MIGGDRETRRVLVVAVLTVFAAGFVCGVGACWLALALSG